MNVLKWSVRLPGRILILCVRFYQVCISPLFGPTCRFTPSCSTYFIEAVKKHGAVIGSAKGAWRIVRCNPFCKGGHDPP